MYALVERRDAMDDFLRKSFAVCIRLRTDSS